MSQWGFYFNQDRCVNCKACTVACKSWNDDKRGDAAINVSLSWLETGKYANPSEYENLPGSTGRQNYAEFGKYHMKEFWRKVTKTEYGTVPPDVDVLGLSLGCNHCDKPACIDVCPMQIISKEPEYGVVLVDNTNCISCGKCKDACPWGSPQFYDPNFRKYTETDPNRPKMTKAAMTRAVMIGRSMKMRDIFMMFSPCRVWRRPWRRVCRPCHCSCRRRDAPPGGQS